MNAVVQPAEQSQHEVQMQPQKPKGVRKASVIGPWGPRIVLIAVAAVTLFSIGFVLFGASGDAIGRIIFTDIALVMFGMLVWTDAIIGRYRPDWFEVTSMAADAYILLIWVGIIWLGAPDGLDILLGLYVLALVRVALLHLDLARWLMKRWNSQINRVIGGIAIASVSAFFIMLTLPCLEIFEHLWDAEMYWRILAALSMLGTMSTILVPLTALLYNRKPKNLDASHQTQQVAPFGYGAPSGYGAATQAGHFGAPTELQQTSQDFAYVAGSAPAGSVHVVPDAAPAVIGIPPAAFSAPVPPASPAESATFRPSTAEATHETPDVSVSPAADPATPAYAAAPSTAAGQTRAWPRLVDGTPLPLNAEGAPDFTALRPGQQLAWPTFVDGTPVPANPDGTPLGTD